MADPVRPNRLHDEAMRIAPLRREIDAGRPRAAVGATAVGEGVGP
jgi:hypothetical protein